MKIKVCGMKYQDNITQLATLQPDYLGFIFYKKSARHFDIERIPVLPNSIKKTGVFVNADIDFIIKKINMHDLQAVQLHGEESPEYCLKLKRLYQDHIDVGIASGETDGRDFEKKSRHDKTIELIKVFSVKNEFNFGVLKPYEHVVDYFLFDTKGKLPGGNGYTFNWNILNNYPSTKPFFLSGGIGLDEVENIKKFQKSQASNYCYAVDVNSKFEIKPGLKNIEDLKVFKHSVI